MLDYWLVAKRVIGVVTSVYLVSSGQVLIPKITYLDSKEKLYCDAGDVLTNSEVVGLRNAGQKILGTTPSPVPTEMEVEVPDENSNDNDEPEDASRSNNDLQQEHGPQPQPTQPPAPTSVPPTKAPAPAVAESSGVDVNGAVNSYRSSKGLGSLQTRGDVCDVAKQRAGEAVNNFGHGGFESAVSSLDYSGVAENLWQGSSISAEQIIDGWDQSPGHQQNLVGNWVYGCGAISGKTAAYIFMR